MCNVQSLDRLPEVLIEAALFDRLENHVEIMPERLSHVSCLLRQELGRAKVRAKIPGGVITINSEVVFSYGHSSQVHKVKVVLPEKADVQSGLIPVTSLIGVALIGLSAGDTMSWRDKDGLERNLTVRKVD